MAKRPATSSDDTHAAAADAEAAAPAEEQPAAHCAYQRLTAMLLAGDFPAGGAVREATLAQQLGFSRNAIREALNRLVDMDVLEYIPYCGYRLMPYTPRDLLEWSYCRLGIEPVALELFFETSWKAREEAFAEMEAILDQEAQSINAGELERVARCDFSFHLKIVEHSENRRLSANYLRCALPFLANISQKGPQGMVSPESDYCLNNLMSLDEQLHTNRRHRELLEEMHHGEPEKAIAMLRGHIAQSILSTKNHLVHKSLEECPQGTQQNADSIGNAVSLLLNGK